MRRAALLAGFAIGCTTYRFFAPPMAPPAGLRVVAAVESAAVYWEHVAGATEYEVRWGTDPSLADPSAMPAVDPPATIPGLAPGVVHYVCVIARDEKAATPCSTILSVQPLPAAWFETAAWWTFTTSIEWGDLVASGDFNGDGRGDVVTGSPHFSIETGIVDVFLARPASTPSILAEFYFSPDVPGNQLGHAAATGDLDGNGYDDLAVGEPGGAGNVRLAFGGPTGLGGERTVEPLTAGNTRFGSGVAIGDVDCDGAADLLVGEPVGSLAHLYLGPVDPSPTPLPSWSHDDVADSEAGGRSVALADLTGDGCDEVIVGAPLADPNGADSGAVWIWPGGAGGPGAPFLDVNGSGQNREFGHLVAPAGDVDGDGSEDLLVTGRWETTGSNEVWLQRGDLSSVLPPPELVFTGDPSGTNPLELAFAPAGDVDGDGFDDVLIGDPEADSGANVAGEVVLLLGGPAGLGTSAAFRLAGTVLDGKLGAAVARSDVDGDGVGDLLVGEPREQPANDAEMRIYRGLPVRGPDVYAGFPGRMTARENVVPRGATFRDPRSVGTWTCTWTLGIPAQDAVTVEECTSANVSDVYLGSGAAAGTYPLILRVTSDDGRYGEAAVLVEVMP